MRAFVVATVVISCGLASADARAQGSIVDVKTVVNAETVKEGDTFQVDVVVTLRTNASVDELTLPDLSAFTVVRDTRSERSSMKMAGGKRSVTQETTHTFLVRATSTGEKTIGPAVVRVGKVRARAEGLIIRVLPDDKPRARRGKKPKSDPYVLELTFDKDEVFVGEQATLTARVYATGPAELRPLSMPKLPQFWVETLDQGGGRPSERSVDGTHYYVYQLHTAALFPLSAGEHTVEPIDLSATVGGGLWSRGKTFNIQSEPVTLRVKPLPTDGAPSDFNPGNVGRFAFKMRAEPLRTTLGQPVSVEMTVTGTGNGGQVTVPGLPERIEGARVFPPTFDENKSIVDGRVALTKRVTALVQPTRAGRLTIPGTRFVFFDPETGRFETKEATPITVVVDSAESAPSTEISNGRARIARGARPIVLRAESAPPFAPYRHGLFFPTTGALLLLGGALAGLGSWRARRRESGAFATAARRRERRAAMEKARDERDLARARTLVEDALAARVGDDVRALTADALVPTLVTRGVGQDLAARVATLFLDVESVLYAPAAGRDRRALFDEALSLLDGIEGAT
jgi:hypothetical protein